MIDRRYPLELPSKAEERRNELKTAFQYSLQSGKLCGTDGKNLQAYSKKPEALILASSDGDISSTCDVDPATKVLYLVEIVCLPHGSIFQKVG